jgi:hypothetical protein
MSKQQALERLRRQVAEIENVRRGKSSSPAFKKWHRDTQVAIEKIFGSTDRHLQDFTSVRYSLMAFSDATPDSVFEQRFRNGLDNAKSVLESLIQEVEEYGCGDGGPTTDAVGLVRRICERFHVLVRQIRDRHSDRTTLSVEDEYDVQDLLHAVLVLHFEDVRKEEWTPSYAGSSSRMDFLLKQEQIVIETKKTRNGLAAKEVGEQLIIDIQKYQAHPDCRILICLVYDPEGRVANPQGIEKDLSKSGDDLQVIVLIVPKGT